MKPPALPRPTVLTEAVQRQIVQALSEGSYLAPACRGAGIGTDCFDDWRRLHGSGAERARPLAGFFRACEVAAAPAESTALRVVRSGAPG